MVRSKGRLPATIAEVAGRAGVSIATVSRVLNQKSSVAAGTAARVQTAMAELRYFPRPAARSLPSHRAYAIGLTLPEIPWDNFFPPLLRGISAAAAENDLGLLIYSSRTPAPADGSGPNVVGAHNTDGLLIFPDGMPAEEILRLHASGFPIVLLHFTLPSAHPIPHVAFENKAGSRAMVDHLIEAHGHRRIGFLAGPAGNQDSQWRERGYRESIEAHGLTADPALIEVGGFDPRVAEMAVAGWIRDGLRPDAVFAADDDSAIGAIQAFRKAGVRVPEDVAVVGFDDVPSARYISPPLTTVRAPIESSGYQAARLLIRQIDHVRSRSEILLPTRLVIRRSCGCIGSDAESGVDHAQLGEWGAT